MKKTMMAAAVFAAIFSAAAYAETNEQTKVQSGAKFGEAVSAGAKSPAAGGLASQKSVSALSQAVSVKGPGGPGNGGPGTPVPGSNVPSVNHPQPRHDGRFIDFSGAVTIGKLFVAVASAALCIVILPGWLLYKAGKGIYNFFHKK